MTTAILTAAADPKQDLLNQVGDKADGIEVIGTSLLVAVYVRAGKSKGGIILPGTVATEDKWQGKVGLVIDLADGAFEEDATHKFGNIVPKVGDWVLYNIGDTFAFNLGAGDDAVRMRIIEDVHVKAILASPDGVM